MLAPLAANAQWNFRRTPNDTLHSVQVLPDGKVAVRIYAPEAQTVSMGGDVWARAPFVKAENGVWETVLEGVAPGTYRYHFVVDGVKTYAVSLTNDAIGYVLTDNNFAFMGHIIGEGIADETLSVGKHTGSYLVTEYYELLESLE